MIFRLCETNKVILLIRSNCMRLDQAASLPEREVNPYLSLSDCRCRVFFRHAKALKVGKTLTSGRKLHEIRPNRVCLFFAKSRYETWFKFPR